ncbi:xanthine dehydrogenase family protein molybdopterin-binding subunit [Chloroflexota bacterium]
MVEYEYIGKSIPRIDAPQKVTGQAKFTDDHIPLNALYCKMVRSPYPHAKILSVNISKAERLPGVRGIITGKDIPPRRFGRFLEDSYILPVDNIVRHVGDPVAAVAAESLEVAEEAVDLIDVEYEELPAVFSAEEAMQKDCPVIVHPELANYSINLPLMKWVLVPDSPNIMQYFKVRQGDLERGFEESDLIIEDRYETIRVSHCQMEPHTYLAWIDPEGIWTIMASMQTPSVTQDMISRLFEIPMSKVRVLSPWCGGGFGGKASSTPSESIAMALANITSRPVSIVLTRAEAFYCTDTRFPIVTYIKDGIKKDGTLVARKITMICDVGAYATVGGLLVKNAIFGAVGSYRIPNFWVDSYGVYTNLTRASAYRGVGTPEVTWAIENQMDVIAEKLGLDPVELRQKNLLREGETDATGQVVYSTGASQCLTNVAEAIGWTEEPINEGGSWRRGKGVAMGNKYTIAGTTSTAIVKVFPDGIIEVRENASGIGQGSHSAMAQIAAEEFGDSIDKIRIVHGDTAICSYEPGSWSSRSVFHTGNAVIRACQDAKRQIFKIASSIMKVTLEDLAIKEGNIYQKTLPVNSIPLRALFTPVGVSTKGADILGQGSYTTPIILEDENGQSERMVAYYSYCPYGAEVAVNIETGEVKVLRVAASSDQGQPINPKACEGQIEGGMSQGLGGGIYEEMIYENGIMINPNLMDYQIPTVMEIPVGENMISIIGGVPHKEGPFGAKGLGESTMTAIAPAIANAIYNAVGLRIKKQPTSRQKVWAALQDKISG